MKTIVKIAAILTFALFGAVFLAAQSNKRQEVTRTKTETAGEKFKSIKVLNEMPADQMGKVMNMMAASLGVNCKFCHAEGDRDFEKEGITHKDEAREMLRMTFEINKNYFKGRPEINCSTCHQGKSRPQSSIPLKPLERERPAEQPVQQPSVEEILARYEAALGGRANFEKITSRLIKAERIEPDGKTREAEEILQKGSKMLIATVYSSKQYGDYVVAEIFDGKAARKTGNGAEIQLKADESEQIRREAEIFANPDLKRVYPKMEFRYVGKIEDREVFVVHASGERLYFDAQTGLLVRRLASAPTVLGDFEYRVDYTDYKDFGGVKLPTVVKFAVPNIRWTRRILEVKNNVLIDDKKFTN